jgi:hypothetical protein
MAGVVAAGVWAAAEPLLQRTFRTPYSDVRLLGRAVTRRGAWPAVGTAIHLANGALFGLVWERLGGRGWKRGLIAAQVENVAFWPGMAIVDRYHPDRRAGELPPLVWSKRVFGYEVATHALFGVVLGLLCTDSVAPP